MRFILVDRVEEIRPGEFIRGIKNITLSDDVFTDHFPGHPLFPGTLIVEALAQLGGCLAECSFHQTSSETRRAVLMQIREAKFHAPCLPGDQLELACTMASSLEHVARLEGEATVRGKRIAAVELTFRLIQVDTEAVHQQRRELYRTWMQGLDLAQIPIR